MKYYIYILTMLLFLLGGCANNTPKELPIKDVATKAITQNQFYFLGDSITAGYQLPIEQSYPYIVGQQLGIKIINAGKSGDTSKGLRDRLTWTLAGAKAGDIVFVLIGGNDSLQSLGVAQLTENIDFTIKYILSKNLTPILLGMQIPTNLNKDYIKSFEEVYPKLAIKNNIKFLPSFLSGVGGIPNLNLPDGIHPNSSGYNILADKIVSYINENSLINK